MNEIIKLILSLSLSGSILALILFSIKPFIKNRLSKSIQYYIWVIVLLRLILPFSMEESLMNKIFYTDKIQASELTKMVMPTNNEKFQKYNSLTVINARESVRNGVYNKDVNHNGYLKDLFDQFNYYVIYAYLLGVAIVLVINIGGYLKFIKSIRATNISATSQEKILLGLLINHKDKVEFLRNPLVNTPILIGILKPKIILPDINYDEKQLKNILLHELTHLRRFDIGIKWLTMIATSIHWFNPMMYLIRKEINYACELSCDEAVIRDLDSVGKQEYGETLISIVSEHKNSTMRLQSTMSEDKKTLKGRLMAIMNYSEKSKPIIVISGILILAIIFGSLYIGAGSGKLYSINNNINSMGKIPIKPPVIMITNKTDLSPIDLYKMIEKRWDGENYPEHASHEVALENNLLTNVHGLFLEEEIVVNFGEYKPDTVLVNMTYLSDNQKEPELPIINIPIKHVNGVYKIKNPSGREGDIKTTLKKIFCITATWGDNVCEYIFATDDNADVVTHIPLQVDMMKLDKLQDEADRGNRPDLLNHETVALEFLNSIEITDIKDYTLKTMDHNENRARRYTINKIMRYESENSYEIIELNLIQPIKEGVEGIWTVDLYHIKNRTDFKTIKVEN